MKSEEKTKNKDISRRNFIKAAGIAAIGVSTGGCASAGKKKTEIAPKVNISRDFKNRTDFDVVVAGTGMGGSAAGALAAHHGLKTLILEKNPRPGGACSYYEKKGFHIDVTPHAFVSGNKGPFGDLTKRLGMGTPIEFIRAKKTTIRGINGDFTIPKNFILRATKAPELLWEAGINPVKYFPLTLLGMKMMAMDEEDINRLDNVSLETFLKQHISDPKLRSIAAIGLGQVLFFCPPDKISAGEAIYSAQNTFKHPHFCYPKGGAVAISKTFLKGAEMHGAEIRMNAGVKKIIVKDGRVDHVILPNEEKVKTRTVISTTSAKDTVFKLVGEEYFPEDYVEKVRNIFPSYSAVTVNLAFEKPVVDCGVFLGLYPRHTSKKDVLCEYFPTVLRNMYDGVQGDYIPVYAPVPTNFDPDLAPPGCQLITATAPAPHLDIELKDQPDIWNEGIMRALRDLIPDFDKHLLFYDHLSVKATAQWIGKSNGSLITTAQVIGQVGKDRIAHATPVKGLYLAGDNAGPARGECTELACQSGMDCGDLIANDIRANLV